MPNYQRNPIIYLNNDFQVSASNDPRNMPKSEVNDPNNPARLPTTNPSLLVVDCIRLDRIGELTIEPTIKREVS